MPGELKDPEQWFPFYYDPRYNEVPNSFESGTSNINDYLESIIKETLGIRIGPGKLETLKEELNRKGYFHRNPGSEEFRSEVVRQTKRLMMAKKVAQSWLI